MKARSWRVALIGVVLLMSGTTALADDFYVIAGGGGVGTRITSVPYNISTPGFYYLSGDLTYSGSTTAIAVNANDVTLDLMGFSLTNNGAVGSTKGINMYGRSNVEIRNGTVRGFNWGLYDSVVSSTTGQHRAINVRAYGNTVGILFSSSNNLIKGCNASGNTSTGLYMYSGLITDCVASNNNIGIWVLRPSNVIGNAVFNNSTHNLYLGIGVATAIMVDRNSAFGLNPNYYITAGTTGLVGIGSGTITNAGAP